MRWRWRIVVAASIALVVLACDGDLYNVNPGHSCRGHEGVTAWHRGHQYTCEKTGEGGAVWTKSD